MTPQEVVLKDSEVIYKTDFNKLIDTLQTVKNGREKIDGVAISYKATGYADKSLDSTYKIRK